MPQKTKTKKTWLWILLGIVGFIILVTVGVALTLYFVSSFSGSKSVDTYDYAMEESGVYAPTESSQGVISENSEDLVDVSRVDTATGEATENKVIKTGSLRIEVQDIDDSSTDIINLAQTNGGFVQSSNVYTDTNSVKSGTVVIKVPADKFESVYEEVKNLALDVKREDVSGQDVTEEYTDLQAQLNNYRAEEQQYLAILEKAQSVDDILKVTKQLSIVRGNIDVIEGRIKYLESMTDFSTLTVYLLEEVKVELPTASWRPLNNLKTAFSYWVKSLQWLADALVWVVIFFGPVVLVIWLIVWLIRKRSKKQ